jgi:hypothetical protein
MISLLLDLRASAPPDARDAVGSFTLRLLRALRSAAPDAAISGVQVVSCGEPPALVVTTTAPIPPANEAFNAALVPSKVCQLERACSLVRQHLPDGSDETFVIILSGPTADLDPGRLVRSGDSLAVIFGPGSFEAGVSPGDRFPLTSVSALTAATPDQLAALAERLEAAYRRQSTTRSRPQDIFRALAQQQLRWRLSLAQARQSADQETLVLLQSAAKWEPWLGSVEAEPDQSIDVVRLPTTARDPLGVLDRLKLGNRLADAAVTEDAVDLARLGNDYGPAGRPYENAISEESRKLVERASLLGGLTWALAQGDDDQIERLARQLAAIPGPPLPKAEAYQVIRTRRRQEAARALVGASGDAALLAAAALARRSGYAITDQSVIERLRAPEQRRAKVERVRDAIRAGQMDILASVYHQPGVPESDLLKPLERDTIRRLLGEIA